jgi:uncharacterized protein (TIGR00297 family)
MAMFVLESVIGVLALCTLLAFLAYSKKVLDKLGSVLAFLVGAVIGIFGGVFWLGLLVFFLITSYAATKYKYALKRERGVQEGKTGERHFSNVLANGLAPTFIAFISFEGFNIIEEKWMAEVAFVAAISVAASDTLASELGVFSDRTYLITNFKKRVKPGTHGGISMLGQEWAFIAAAYTSIFGWILLFFVPHVFLNSNGNLFVYDSSPAHPLGLVLIPLIIGFAGCQFDSVLGATLERKGLISNNAVNLLATSTGGLVAWMILLLI